MRYSPVVVNALNEACLVEEARQIAFEPRSVNNPQHIPVKLFSRSSFLGPEVRVLKLDREAMRGMHIRDVFLSKLVKPDDLLPCGRELAFPDAVPFCFAFPPGVAVPLSAVGPVMDA
jgi:hypothetical protein